ncbi:hypothetical protein CLOSTASPAR_05545 [[Clostridium] asparagiforme DSM 15981]|uniref:Uncharacterized protein n=1 Tax=[Clostridium] asparagiforme DSM 15981 TaxID=518636 RepID=C0D8E7_9FIRM|nr:hypothetical protein CLOSTASPAR_05545 [[Clostridium] asparagiforme DSM 15981]
MAGGAFVCFSGRLFRATGRCRGQGPGGIRNFKNSFKKVKPKAIGRGPI